MGNEQRGAHRTSRAVSTPYEHRTAPRGTSRRRIRHRLEPHEIRTAPYGPRTAPHRALGISDRRHTRIKHPKLRPQRSQRPRPLTFHRGVVFSLGIRDLGVRGLAQRGRAHRTYVRSSYVAHTVPRAEYGRVSGPSGAFRRLGLAWISRFFLRNFGSFSNIFFRENLGLFSYVLRNFGDFFLTTRAQQKFRRRISTKS